MFFSIRVLFGLVVAGFDAADGVSNLVAMNPSASHSSRLPHLCSVPSHMLGLGGKLWQVE